VLHGSRTQESTARAFSYSCPDSSSFKLSYPLDVTASFNRDRTALAGRRGMLVALPLLFHAA
jgi:hypothetical protein